MTSFSCHNILIKEENICMVCCVPFHLYCVFFHFMSTVYKRSHIGVVETSSDHQCEIDWYLHWSSLPLHLPSSQVENPRMDWDSILNGQICQTQEQPIFFLCWFCLRHGVSGVDSKCLLVCFGCTLGPRFRMYPWTFDPSCIQIGPVLFFALMMISQARRPSCWPH